MKRAAFLLLLLLLPSVAAQVPTSLYGEGNEGEPFRYQIRDHTSAQTGGFSTTFDFLKLHTHEIGPGGRLLRIDLTATYTVQPSTDGAWRYQVLVDNIAIQDCRWDLTTRDPGGFLTGDLIVIGPFHASCTVDPTISNAWTEGQTIPVQVTRSVQSGNPTAPVGAHTNLVIDREDFAIMSHESSIEALLGISGVDYVLLVAAALAVLIVGFASKNTALRATMAILGIMVGVIFLSLQDSYLVILHGLIVGVAAAVLAAQIVLDTIPKTEKRSFF